jgi:hypothetical protein
MAGAILDPKFAIICCAGSKANFRYRTLEYFNVKFGMFFVRARSELVDGIELRGRSEFLRQSKKSLELLKASPQFEVIRANVAIIRQGRRSGMRARAKKPTFVVGKKTWRHSVVWYAGAIAHDAYHAKLYREAKEARGECEPEADAWTGAEAEKKCLAFQRDVMAQLNADPSAIAYLKTCEKNPTYQGRNRGWRGWLDYLKRQW